MNRRIAWVAVLTTVGLLGVSGPVWYLAGASDDPPGRRNPFAQAITDKEVEPFGLAVQWKALTWLGEHARPTGLYVSDQEVFTTDDYSRLTCFDRVTGKRLWMQRLGRPHQPIFEPTVDGPDAFVIASGYLIALDRKFGGERWRIKLKNIPSGKAAVAEDFIYVASAEGWLRAYSRLEQKERWYFNARSPIVGHPVVVGTGKNLLVTIATNNRKIYCLSNKERKIIWEDETLEPMLAPPGRLDRYLYLGSTDFNVYAIDALAATRKDRLRWIFRTGGQVTATPQAVGATVYFPSVRQGFYAVRRLDGKLRWHLSSGVHLLAVGRRRCYVLDEENAILICDKLTGKLLGRFVIPKAYRLVGTNLYDEAIYLLSKEGLLVCLRERESAAPKGTAGTP